jgi:hypothetical protein
MLWVSRRYAPGVIPVAQPKEKAALQIRGARRRRGSMEQTPDRDVVVAPKRYRRVRACRFAIIAPRIEVTITRRSGPPAVMPRRQASAPP